MGATEVIDVVQCRFWLGLKFDAIIDEVLCVCGLVRALDLDGLAVWSLQCMPLCPKSWTPEWAASTFCSHIAPLPKTLLERFGCPRSAVTELWCKG